MSYISVSVILYVGGGSGLAVHADQAARGGALSAALSLRLCRVWMVHLESLFSVLLHAQQDGHEVPEPHRHRSSRTWY